MSDLPHFPRDTFGYATLLWELMGMTIEGGQTASGVKPVARLDGGGLWKAAFGEVGVYDTDRRRTWRAISAIADGGAQPLILTVLDPEDPPWPLVGGSPLMSLAVVAHSDSTLFSDGSGYSSDCIEASTVDAVDLRSTNMTIDIAAGEDLQGGEYFSIDHDLLRWRLYRVRTAIDNGDGTFDVTFRPPLRAAINASTPLQFDHPKCVMRLASPDAMDATYESSLQATPSPTFIEAFPPFPSFST